MRGSTCPVCSAVLIVALDMNRRGFSPRHLAFQPVGFWLIISASSALTEEVWRAVCLTALAGQGHKQAVVVTAVAFGLAHLEPLGRAIGAALFGVVAAWLFFTFGNAWILVFAHLPLDLGVRYVVRLAPP